MRSHPPRPACFWLPRVVVLGAAGAAPGERRWGQQGRERGAGSAGPGAGALLSRGASRGEAAGVAAGPKAAAGHLRALRPGAGRWTGSWAFRTPAPEEGTVLSLVSKRAGGPRSGRAARPRESRRAAAGAATKDSWAGPASGCSAVGGHGGAPAPQHREDGIKKSTRAGGGRLVMPGPWSAPHTPSLRSLTTRGAPLLLASQPGNPGRTPRGFPQATRVKSVAYTTWIRTQLFYHLDALCFL